MSDKSTVSRGFNSLMDEFVEDVITVLPENNEIRAAKASLGTIRKMNPMAVIRLWHKYVYVPYSELITKGDISFFFDKDYGHDLRNMPNAEKIITAIDNIRGPVKSMDSENQKCAMSYIQKLSKLSFVYSQLK